MMKSITFVTVTMTFTTLVFVELPPRFHRSPSVMELIDSIQF